MFSEIFIKGEDRTQELRQFANTVGLNRSAEGRYSSLFLAQLFIQSFELGVLNAERVVVEIEALEGMRQSHTKAPTAFRKPPLQGLWHKHHTVDGISSMAMNMLNGIRKDGIPWLEKSVKEAMDSGEERFVTEDDIRKICNDAVVGNYERRFEAKEMTGEWIVYACHKEKNYYLCLGAHNTGDDVIRRQIDSACVPEFPFLEDVLVPWGKAPSN
ncbi:hypothetical protein IB256_09870 [Pseudomonas sp. PDM17]|uniref:hypothetical protein n=1 Tax=Pseudomonas sp. PDM17 TaxID=2769285 RepID=UPI0017848039|nr:hypothetical protein [Pseudomonas sp. PDM17]MBD9501085.1 hypothetical protein [Pseudomonas sp. PDM17]